MKRLPPEPINPEVERRCAEVLNAAFMGLHHIPYWSRRRACGPYGMEVSDFQDFATFDGELLTRLVIAAHDYAVRVSIQPGGPRMLVIRMWPRKREGRRSERHPEIEDAVAEVRRWTRPVPAPSPEPAEEEGK